MIERAVQVMFLALGSGEILWSSKKQDVVALSSSEAEYVAVTSTACQALWLQRVLVDIHQKQDGATEMYCYNKATIAMTRNLAFHSRTKHIDIHYHIIRSHTADGELQLKFCPTNEQKADILTKSLSQAKHYYFRKLLGVCMFEARELSSGVLCGQVFLVVQAS